MLPLVCRGLVWTAEKLVPASDRDEWRDEYSGQLWQWTLDAAIAGTGDSRFALKAHTRRAVRAALRTRFCTEQFGTPTFCLSAGGSLILLLAVLSGGFRVLRHVTPSLSYRDPQQVVVLAQGPPIFGIRLGFRDRDTQVFRSRAHSVESVATYMWSTTVFQADGRYREIVAAETGPQFFDVLGVGPSLGTGLDGPDSFLASYDFWKSQLGASRSALGERFEIGGRSLRLAGVMPRSFAFLSAPIAVWTVAGPELPVSQRRWQLALRGAVARLRPGVSQDAAEKELRQLLVDAHLARPNFSVRATPIADLVYEPARSYALDLLMSTSLILLWAGFNVFRDRGRGAPWRMTSRFWGFFGLKTMLPLIALFLFVFEFGGVTQLGVTGGVRPGSGPLGAWFFYSGIVMILIWAWRDQPSRCRVCLRQMRLPLRIGIPGMMLLETAGQEVMCPQGHGSVYTTASVLGADLSDRWMGFS
ncbi:MAG: ABC transporter permease [Acidobacteriota bacterium]